MTELTIKSLPDKVRGCWLGKNIGGTLGGPFEGAKVCHDLSFYDPVPDKPLPNDDLDLQLVWLVMLESLGGREPTLTDFADAWLRWLRHYPWDEYGICLWNLESGLRPPISGCFRNGYIDNMGSPIRSELWACLSPGDPQGAALLAMKDAILDHAGGEGMYGEIFWAAVQSASFVSDDPQRLIRIGLSMIPLHCRIARVVREALLLHERGLTYEDARQKITTLFASPARQVRTGPWQGRTDGGVVHPCHAVPNHGFAILGWLYGRDFGDALCKAVNCGYDTDCTAATLGATLGILRGADGLPARWVEPVGTEIVLHKFTGDLPGAPANVDELTRRVLNLHERMRGKAADTEPSRWSNARAHEALRRFDAQSTEVSRGEVSITLHYYGEPVLYPGERRFVQVIAAAGGVRCEAKVKLRAPDEWQIEADGAGWWLCAPHGSGRETTEVTAEIDSRAHTVAFTWLPPSEALWPVEQNVMRCGRCEGRYGACLCDESIAQGA